MPKKGRKMDLPTTIEPKKDKGGDFIPTEEVLQQPIAATWEYEAVEGKPDKTVSIQLPVGELGSGYGGTNRVDVQRMTPKQKRTLRRVLRGLEDSGARMADGRPVRTAQDVFKYILDRVG